MPRTTITDQLLKRVSPAPGSRAEYWDSYLEGFGYRASQVGKGTFFVMYRIDGKQRRMTIGRYPVITLKDARAKATEALELTKHEKDPATVEADRQRQENERRARTLELAANDYFTLYTKHRPSTRDEVKRVFEREVLPTLGQLPITSITRRDLARVVNVVSDRGAKAMANRLVAYLGSFFKWLVDRAELESSPTAGLAKPHAESSRERVLSDQELRAVWLAANDMGPPFGRIVQLLILTGQRRDEVGGMLKHELQLEKGLWVIPPERNKSHRVHEVPLSAMTEAIIRQALVGAGEVLFAPKKLRKTDDLTPRPISGWSSFKVTLDEHILSILQEDEDKEAARNNRAARPVSMSHYTLHDLRRTVTTGIARLGVAPHVADRLLNHSAGTISGVAKVYNRFKYEGEMRAAADLWADHVGKLVGWTGAKDRRES